MSIGENKAQAWRKKEPQVKNALFVRRLVRMRVKDVADASSTDEGTLPTDTLR